MGYSYEESNISIRKTDSDWELYENGEPVIPCRTFSTRAQAFLAVGLIEMIRETGREVTFQEYDRLLITNNLLITGKRWVTE